MLQLALRRLPVLAFLLLVAAPLVGQDWAGRGRLQGRVTDEDGKPIAGATVRLYFEGQEGFGPEPLTTDQKGRWSILGLRNGQWTVTVAAGGYVSSQGLVPVSEIKINPSVDVTLRRLEDTEQAKKGRAVQGAVEEANAAFTAGDYGRARQLFEQVLPDLSDDSKPAVQLGIAQTWIREGNLDQGLAVLEQVLATQPDNRQAQILQAAVYGEKGDAARATQILEGIVAAEPQNTRAIQMLANLLTQEGREADAQRYLAMLPEDQQEVDPDILLNLGIEKYNAGDYAAALAQFDRVVQQDPEMADAYYYRGLAQLASGNSAAAKADFEKLLAIDPQNPKAAEAREFLKDL